MDGNKLEKLREIGYEIKPACGTCCNAWFSSEKTDFGDCDAHIYEHQKHSDQKRHLSVFRYGSCSKWEAGGEVDDDMIHGFKEFLRE